ncbi:MAG: LegC family aminotransferase [Paracoccaceae bacterium]
MMRSSQSASESVLNAVTSAIGPSANYIGLHEPSFDSDELENLSVCLDSGWVSSAGSFVTRFEEEIAEYCGVKYSISTVNGTSALQLALKVVGVKEKDEVLTPAISFVATANAVTFCGAIPHFIDVEYTTLGIDPDALEIYLNEVLVPSGKHFVNKNSGRVVRAIVPMHTFGHPVRMEKLMVVAKKFNLMVVEDAAESLGSFYNSKHTGSFGNVAALSFNGNKIITTGGGGAVLTNNKQAAMLAKHLSTTAKKTHHWEFDHDQVGFNFRMPNINAALGCAQLKKLPKYLHKKRLLAEVYKSVFVGSQVADFFEEPENCKSNYWLNTIILKKEYVAQRDEIISLLQKNNFGCRPVWKMLSTLPMYVSNPAGPLDVSKKLSSAIINLPSSPDLL